MGNGRSKKFLRIFQLLLLKPEKHSTVLHLSWALKCGLWWWHTKARTVAWWHHVPSVACHRGWMPPRNPAAPSQDLSNPQCVNETEVFCSLPFNPFFSRSKLWNVQIFPLENLSKLCVQSLSPKPSNSQFQDDRITLPQGSRLWNWHLASFVSTNPPGIKKHQEAHTFPNANLHNTGPDRTRASYAC